MKRNDLPTPCYLVSEAKLTRNLEILKGVSTRTGCKILLAQKAFSMFAVYPLIAKYLDGAASSGLYEARLAHEHMGRENHTFSPAFRDDQFAEIAAISGHIVFNSLAQFQKFGATALSAGVSCGLRVNPEHSTQDHAIYDPCAPGSRLGVLAENPLPELPDGIEGLHFHTLCEQGADALKETLDAVCEKFDPWLRKVQWINFGGGHHITKPGYDIPLLESSIRRMQRDYSLEVYLEPGEAVALDAGILITTVLDVVHNGLDVAILDASAACHMPDVIEMPYRPPLHEPGAPYDFARSNAPSEPCAPVDFAHEMPGASPADHPIEQPHNHNHAGQPGKQPNTLHLAGQPGEKSHTYRLAGPTCLAGDVIGDYSFDALLSPGDRLEFLDMAIYTMVKNNTFNGMPLPAIAVEGPDGNCRVIKRFGYEDFKARLS